MASGDLVRVTTEIGYFVDKVWVTEGIRPGVVACSHHLGRWRLAEGDGTSRIASTLVDLVESGGGGGGLSGGAGGAGYGGNGRDGLVGEVAGGRAGGAQWSLRQRGGIKPFKSADPDTSRVWWTDAGVHQNLTFPVQPDPISGMHCWHQKVTVARAKAGDQYGDVWVDTQRSHEVFRNWLSLTRPPQGEWRRPHWMLRPFRPELAAFRRPTG